MTDLGNSSNHVIFAWHVHHDVLIEPLVEPLENRIAYIRGYKSTEEVPTRLRLLHVVNGMLPQELIEAGRIYTIQSPCAATFQDYREAGRVYSAILARHTPEIETLHRAECLNCPWDGKTIFPKMEKSAGEPDQSH